LSDRVAGKAGGPGGPGGEEGVPVLDQATALQKKRGTMKGEEENSS